MQRDAVLLKSQVAELLWKCFFLFYQHVCRCLPSGVGTLTWQFQAASSNSIRYTKRKIKSPLHSLTFAPICLHCPNRVKTTIILTAFPTVLQGYQIPPTTTFNSCARTLGQAKILDLFIQIQIESRWMEHSPTSSAASSPNYKREEEKQAESSK